MNQFLDDFCQSSESCSIFINFAYIPQLTMRNLPGSVSSEGKGHIKAIGCCADVYRSTGKLLHFRLSFFALGNTDN